MTSAPAAREGLEVGVGRRDHQVDVERQRAVAAQRRNDHGAEADVGHEVPVHDVEVQPVRARLGDRARLLAEDGRSRRRGGKGAIRTAACGMSRRF
jgi:hypothetical protein